MANDLRNDLEAILERFAAELMQLLGSAIQQTLAIEPMAPAAAKKAPKAAVKAVKAAPAAPKHVPVRKNKRGPKSTPAEVRVLAEKLLAVLRKASAPMASKELQAAVHTEAGSFHYALNKLKAAKSVVQHGERRLAKYAAKGAEKVAPVKAAKPAKARKAAKAKKAPEAAPPA